jgi:hypothetical protein
MSSLHATTGCRLLSSELLEGVTTLTHRLRQCQLRSCSNSHSGSILPQILLFCGTPDGPSWPSGCKVLRYAYPSVCPTGLVACTDGGASHPTQQPATSDGADTVRCVSDRHVQGSRDPPRAREPSRLVRRNTRCCSSPDVTLPAYRPPATGGQRAPLATAAQGRPSMKATCIRAQYMMRGGCNSSPGWQIAALSNHSAVVAPAPLW